MCHFYTSCFWFTKKCLGIKETIKCDLSRWEMSKSFKFRQRDAVVQAVTNSDKYDGKYALLLRIL